MAANLLPLYGFSLKGLHTFYGWNLELLKNKRIKAVAIYGDWQVEITEVQRIDDSVVGMANTTLIQ